MLLLSVTVDLEKWLIESLRTSSKRNMAPGYKTASASSAALSLVWWALSVCCSFTVQSILWGVFICVLPHFHSFCGVSPHPGSIMHSVIIRHTLLCLEVSVLYASCLASVDTSHHNVGGKYILVSAGLLWMPHMDSSLSLSLSFLNTSAHTHRHTLCRDIWVTL